MNDLEIRIRAAADGSVSSSTNQAAAAVDKVGAAAKRASGDTVQANKAASKSVNELGENFEKGAAAGRVLSEAMQGNVAAMSQLAPAIKTIGALLKTNLVGMLITLGAVAASVLVPIIKGFREKKKAIDEAGAAFITAAEKARQLRDVKLDALKREIDQVNESAARMVSLFRQALEAQGKQDAADTARQIAAIEDDPSLTPLEKAERIARVKQGATLRAREREDYGRIAEEQAGRESLKRATQIESQRQRERDEQQAKVDMLERDRRERQAGITAREKELESVRERIGSVKSADEFMPLEQRRQQLERELETLRARQALATSPDSKARFDEQRKILAEREAAARAATSAREAASGAYQNTVGANRVAGFVYDETSGTYRVDPNSPLGRTRMLEDASFAGDVARQRRAAVAPVVSDIDARKQAAAGRASTIESEIRSLEDQQMRSMTLGGDPAIGTRIDRLRADFAAATAERDAADADMAQAIVQNQKKSALEARRRTEQVKSALEARDRRDAALRATE